MEDKTTVYCIKYALTSGILRLEGEISPDGYFKQFPYHLCGHHLSRNDYRLTIEEAKDAAEALRKRKIASLEKQLEKVRSQTIKLKQD
jgi:hypothetical protein